MFREYYSRLNTNLSHTVTTSRILNNIGGWLLGFHNFGHFRYSFVFSLKAPYELFGSITSFFLFIQKHTPKIFIWQYISKLSLLFPYIFVHWKWHFSNVFPMKSLEELFFYQNLKPLHVHIYIKKGVYDIYCFYI